MVWKSLLHWYGRWWWYLVWYVMVWYLTTIGFMSVRSRPVFALLASTWKLGMMFYFDAMPWRVDLQLWYGTW